MSVSSPRETGTYLDRILAQTLIDVEQRKQATSVEALRERASQFPAPVGIAAALKRETVTVIAEYKRASPSRGEFPNVPSPDIVAGDYVAGGAAMISCLTDEPFFKGTLADLETVARVGYAAQPAIGALRKDFIIDPFQIDEARAYGASCILLIVACLEPEPLKALYAYAQSLDLSVLVEVHDEAEAEVALGIGANIIGINNRDLRSFEVDLAVTERLAPKLGQDAIVVGESGIFTAEDVSRLAAAGIDAVLVGESLIRQEDRVAVTRALAGVKKP